MTLRVGQRVRVVATEERLVDIAADCGVAGSIGLVVSDDGSDLPLLVKFADGDEWWLGFEDLEPIDTEAPAPQQDHTADKIEMAQLRVEVARWEASSRAWERLYREAVSR
jgi:hypothetical protein